jgi:hypothetical protein
VFPDGRGEDDHHTDCYLPVSSDSGWICWSADSLARCQVSIKPGWRIMLYDSSLPRDDDDDDDDDDE